MDDRGSWFCHNNVPLISPKRLCNSLVTLPPPPPPPPSLATNWQSIFHSIPFILCWQRLIPTPFPTENHRPSRILGSHPRRKWLVPYYNCFLNQPGFQGPRNGTGKPHPTSRWKHFAFLPGFEAFKLLPPSVSEEVMKNQSSLIAGGSTIHALLAITTCEKKSYHQNFTTTG